MKHKRCIAMLLAGGQGSRLGILTRNIAKPAVHFGGKYRIIDFPLSNCTNSDINTVGVLTQYQPLALNSYIAGGQPWDLDRTDGGVFVLPPYMKGQGGQWYKGTANAIYQNIPFIEQFSPEYVLILSGDHIYKMDYSMLLDFHESKGADCTIAVIEVPWNEASRFGIMNTDEDDRVIDFEEKPPEPKSNKASMGVYIFTWSALRKYLEADEENLLSSNDFGKNIIPSMLEDQLNLFAYPFRGYWKDVGTVYSLWEAHMDLIASPPRFELNDPMWRIYARNAVQPPHQICHGGEVTQSLVTEGCLVCGRVNHSVLFNSVQISEGAEVIDSVLMPGVKVERGARIYRAIVAPDTIVGAGSLIGVPLKEGTPDNEGITVIGTGAYVPPGMEIPQGQMLAAEDLQAGK